MTYELNDYNEYMYDRNSYSCITVAETGVGLP